jgi:hypothetical protein
MCNGRWVSRLKKREIRTTTHNTKLKTPKRNPQKRGKKIIIIIIIIIK